MADTLLSTFTPFIPHKRSSIQSSLLPAKPCTLLRRSPLLSTAVAAAATPSSALADELEPLGIQNLHRFFDIYVGKWNGSFYQYDGNGNLLQRVETKLSASTYGEDELMSLIQTLYIRQPPSSTSIEDQDDEPEWFEYKIKETNMFTVDKYQQIGFFPKEKAFSLRYQTAGMLEAVLRSGVLGEDDTGEESPRNLKIPSRFPSIVCENCLYSLNEDMRVRAFHIMDPKGILEMLVLFMEKRGDDVPDSFPTGSMLDKSDRLSPLLGCWKGKSITRRSGVYGATETEADTVALLELNDKGQLIQDISSTAVGSSDTTNVHWTGTINNNLVTFDRGFKMTLLPGGIYMGCPCDIGKCVADGASFHLEFCWTESQEKRQRLVRTYDVEGQAVSSTYFYEIKV